MRKQWLLVSGILVGLLSAAVFYWRPARLREARVAGVERSAYTSAHVELKYARGARPVSVIVDVIAAQGTGSATIEGGEEDVIIPLSGAGADSTAVRTTASYRVLGRMVTDVREFQG